MGSEMCIRDRSCSAVCDFDGRFVFVEFGFRDSVFPVACCCASNRNPDRGDFLVRCVLIRLFLCSYELILILFLIVLLFVVVPVLLTYVVKVPLCCLLFFVIAVLLMFGVSSTLMGPRLRGSGGMAFLAPASMWSGVPIPGSLFFLLWALYRVVLSFVSLKGLAHAVLGNFVLFC